MQRRALALVVGTLIVLLTRVDATPAAELQIPPARFATMPLDTPMTLTGTFGEARSTHFHAGLDLSTRERVGAPVWAPVAGHVVRVRASGAGYGRSLYLLADDGRLLVFAHLDAFDEPLAGYVAGVQDSTGDYEQDLWPDSTRFPVRRGQRLGWSGRSGTGPPHLHFEVRRGDTALNPLRAGAAVRDAGPPVVRAVTLEPLDGGSAVEGRVAPHTLEWSAEAADAPKTVRAHGRLRVIVEALDARGNGRMTMAPYSVALEWRDRRYECRFDSVSWAEGMAEVDLVYDRGRATSRGSTAIQMWSPAGFRSRVVSATEPLAEEAGTIVVKGSSEEIRVVARDLEGHEAARRIVLEDGGPPAARDAPRLFEPEPPAFLIERPQFHEPESGDVPDPLRTASLLAPGELRFAALPGGWLRAEIEGKRWREKMPRAIDFLGQRALDPDAPRLAVVVRPDSLPRDASLRIAGDAPRWTGQSRPWRLIAAVEGGGGERPGLAVRIPAGALFEPAVWALGTTPLAPRNAELVPVGPVFVIEPEDHPLRAAIEVALAVPERQRKEKLGLYRETGEGWEFVRARHDSAGRRMTAETRRLGRFALFTDHRPPRITRVVAAAPTAAGPPYSTWELRVSLADDGSGVDARASRLGIDGRPVPSEWDGEERVLRWRPLREPAPGRHRYTVSAVDRAGNTRKHSGTFVVRATR